MEQIFSAFFGSPAYEELAGAAIIGREVPLLMPWHRPNEGRSFGKGTGKVMEGIQVMEGVQVMEGIIDLLYEREGRLYIADYKTDRIAPKDLPLAADDYRLQAQVYTEAVRKSLKREVAAFKLIFLRLGRAVEIDSAGDFGKS